MAEIPALPKAWISNLGESVAATFDEAALDPIERDAVDGSVPFAAQHAGRYIATAGQDDGWDGPRPILLLYTIGRKSGTIRRNPLLFFEHAGGRYITGSKGGDPVDPSWFINLQANPNVHIRIDAEFFAVHAEVVGGDERAAVWPELTAKYPMFASYAKRTEREIPLIRLHRGEG